MNFDTAWGTIITGTIEDTQRVSGADVPTALICLVQNNEDVDKFTAMFQWLDVVTLLAIGSASEDLHGAYDWHMRSGELSERVLLSQDAAEVTEESIWGFFASSGAANPGPEQFMVLTNDPQDLPSFVASIKRILKPDA